MTISKIGPYELGEELGHGGMGRVYRGRDPRLDRTVAIKFLQGAATESAERRLRFLREARAEASLHHPNIATVLDVGEAEVDLPELLPEGESRGSIKVPYLVLEFVPGDDLRTRIRAGAIPLVETLRIVRQVVEGLRAAHAQGIVHRDLKPGNIRITPDGRAKILDFGLARYVAADSRASGFLTDLQTTEGIVLGTPPYMAPEQSIGLAVDARADLFALGVILYQMVGGRMPFTGEHTVELLQSVLRDSPPPLAELVPSTPPRLVELVDRLLAKSPDGRPRSADEVARELEAIARELHEEPTAIEPSRKSVLPASWASTRKVALPRRRAVALGALALLALAAAAFWIVQRAGIDPEALELVARAERTALLADPQAPRIAAELFERAGTLDDDYALAWARAGQEWAKAFDRDRLPQLLDQATRAVDRAETIDPEADTTRLARARILRTKGEGRSALELLAKIGPESPIAWRAEIERSRAHEQLGDPESAEQALLAAIAARDGEWEAWNELGDFRLRAGSYASSRVAFERAEELAPPGATNPKENLAALLFLEGKYDEALAAYQRIPLSSISPDSASNLGTLLYFNGRIDEAETAFRRAIRMAPRDPLYHRNLADTLLRLGRQEEARTEYVEALGLVDAQLALQPRNETLMLQRALYLARAGQCAKAIPYAAEIDAQLADGARTQRGLAHAFALCDAPSEALAQLRRAIALGFARELLRDEDELAALRGLPEFELLVGKRDG